MPSLFGKAAAPAVKTQMDHVADFERVLDLAIAEARANHCDPRRLARSLKERSDSLQMSWATTAPVI
jgi:hypothetical protein